MKNTVLFLLLLFVPTINLFAQAIQKDSTSIKTKIAIMDARHFKPTKAIRLAHRKHLLLNTSDYFMPTPTVVSNPQFLKDSVYVKAFKNAAYNKSIHNGKSGYYAVVAAEITGAAIAVGVLVFLLLRAAFRSIDIK